MSLLSTTVPTSSLQWMMGWTDQWTDNSHDYGIYAYKSGISPGWAPVSDVMRRDGGYPSWPYQGKVLVVRTDVPLFAKPATSYRTVWTATRGRWAGRSLYVPVHEDPQYIGVGVVVFRDGNEGPPNVRDQPPPVYYCINKAFLRQLVAPIHGACSDGNCNDFKILYQSFKGLENINTDGVAYEILPYDEVIAGCKGLRGVSPLRDISNPDCNYLLDRMYTADDIKTVKADFCSTNPGWCDRTMTKFCTDFPNHSWCDCINTTSRAQWKEVDALLVPAAKGSTLACKSPFCNARNDVFKTSQMVVDGRNCPDIRYIDQSVKVDGQGNITKVTQEGSIGGDTTSTSTSTSTSDSTTNTGDTIVGINPTLFYILLFLFIIIIIVVSIKYSDDEPKQLPPAQAPELTA